MKARYLKRAVVEDLWRDVPHTLATYRAGTFDHLLVDAGAYFEGQFDVDDARLTNLLAGDRSEDEVHACKLMSEAMPGLTPYEARDERFWTYLTHTCLLDYTRQRWQLPDDDDRAAEFVRRHFFARGQRGYEVHNAASRLWWMAYLCRRVDGMSFDDALRIFLARSDVRANIIERPTLSQNAQIFGAIIKLLRTSFAGDKALFERRLFRPLMRSLNSAGGARLLDSMTEPQIQSLLGKLLKLELVHAVEGEAKGTKKTKKAKVTKKAKRAAATMKRRQAKAARNGRATHA